MFASRLQYRGTRWWWLWASLALHAVLVWPLHGREELPSEPLFRLPDDVDFGIAEVLGAEGTPAPPPAPVEAPPPDPVEPVPKPRARRAPVATEGVALVQDAGPPVPSGAVSDMEGGEASAAVSGIGLFGEGDGTGAGGEGIGSGGDVVGATVALNVDLERVRNSALLLETEALLDIIPEWQALLAGSGFDPLRDFRRVFVAAPSLDRAALIVSADHELSRARIGSAVSTLAAERGAPAPFREQDGLQVAPWRNRGPTERVVALTGAKQLLITRSAQLPRVLAVSRSLAALRKRQGFVPEEVEARGGLLAMQTDEAVALWVEEVPRYVRSAVEGIPDSLRLSIFHVDQFHTDLLVTGNYASSARAEEARVSMDALRSSLVDHPRVVFLGLRSALEKAQFERTDRALRVRVRLTLHQTRYLMAYVKRALSPR